MLMIPQSSSMPRGAVRLLLAALALTAIASRATTAAQTYGFYNISNDNAVNAATAGQYTVTVYGVNDDVSGLGFTGPTPTLSATSVLFVFSNVGTAQSSITDVYFQDGVLLGIASVINTTGVNFSAGANPNDLAEATNLTPDFQTHAGFSADSVGDSEPDGVDNSPSGAEKVGILFNLLSGQGYDDVINALNAGFSNPGAIWENDGDTRPGQVGLRIGIEVNNFAVGGSSAEESFVNGAALATPVPEPSTLTAGGFSILLGLGYIWRRRRAIA